MHWAAMPVLNNKDLTIQAVLDCLNQDIPVNVLVVDQCSYDGTIQALQDLGDSRIHILSNDENVGVGAAWNQICDMLFGGIIGDPAEHILIINNDVRLRPDTYRHLLIPRGGFVSGVNAPQHMNSEVQILKEPILKGGPDFSCFLLKRWFWEKVGRFNSCFFSYLEDNAYHARARMLGLDSEIFSVAMPYTHIDSGSQTIKNNPDVAEKNRRDWDRKVKLYSEIFGGPVGHETKYDSLLGSLHWSQTLP